MINPFRCKILTERAVPTLACLALLHTEMPPFDLSPVYSAPAAARREVDGGLDPEQRRLQAFVDTLHAEGAIERLDACGRWDACLSVTSMFEGFSAGDKTAIARLVRRYVLTLPSGGNAVQSVRFIDARTGRELGRVSEDRLIWEPV